MDDYEFYTNRLRRPGYYILGGGETFAPTPFTNRHVTLAKNSLKILIQTSPPNEVLKAMKRLVERDPEFYDRVMNKLEKDYSNPISIQLMRGKVFLRKRYGKGKQ